MKGFVCIKTLYILPKLERAKRLQQEASGILMNAQPEKRWLLVISLQRGQEEHLL